MRQFLPVLLLLLIAAPVLAATMAAPGAPGTNIEMPFLMAPMTGADGKLAGYAYISSRLTATSDSGATDIRDKIPFIQDAFVRDVNGASIGRPDDASMVDMARLQARLLADARRIMGNGKVAALAVVQVQIAQLHARPDANVPPPAAPPGPSQGAANPGPAPAATAKTP